MYLIQLLLPVLHNDGRPVASHLFEAVHRELADKFGGLTVYSRAPAEGTWRDDAERKVQDDLLLFEVMVQEVDREWWRAYRHDLEARFQQQEILIRSFAIEQL
jgi:hypothetical protein